MKEHLLIFWQRKLEDAYRENYDLQAENARLKADVNELADGLKLASEVGIKMADEVTRLKAEVEQARKISGEGMSVTLDLNNQLLAENARLKAEVERLTAFTTRTIIPNEELQAHIERLTNAGDAMYSWLGVCGRHNNSTGDDWLRAKKGLPLLSQQWEIMKRNRLAENAAKEGKQP